MYFKNDNNKILSKRLRQLRINAGYTQQNIANTLNINRSTYTYYETGKTTPDIQTLQTLANIYGIRIDEFLEEESSSTLNDVEGRRPKKKVFDNPQKIGELSGLEKSLIALLRTSNNPQTNTEQLVEMLKRERFQETGE